MNTFSLVKTIITHNIETAIPECNYDDYSRLP